MNTPTLSERLKSETKALHRQVERSGMMATLLRGRIERHDYCWLLRNLYAIYAALEPAMRRHARNPGIAPIHSLALERSASLAEDLNHLHGPAWVSELLMTPAACEYEQQLRRLDETSPLGLTAHAYVRYLGDLSGGQMLRGIVARTLHLDGDEGIRFYCFPEPGAAILAAHFRSGLDAIPLDSEQTTESLVSEAKLGFALHARLFEELGATAFGETQSPRE